VLKQKRRPLVTDGAGLEASRRSIDPHYLSLDGTAILPPSVNVPPIIARHWWRPEPVDVRRG